VKEKKSILKIIGWLLILATVGPIGLIGKEFIFSGEFISLALVPLCVFGIFFALGVWLINRGGKG